jgi:hypothetical protein
MLEALTVRGLHSTIIDTVQSAESLGLTVALARAGVHPPPPPPCSLVSTCVSNTPGLLSPYFSVFFVHVPPWFLGAFALHNPTAAVLRPVRPC